MRWLSILILVTLLHNFLAPHPFISSVTYDEGVSVVTLDVCDTAASEFTTDDDAPVLIQNPGVQGPVFSVTYTKPFNHVFAQLLLTSKNERPPTA